MIWLAERDLVALHQRLLVLHGGAPGVRDMGLLQSALARPQQVKAYEPEADIIRLAAVLTAGIVRNHPFIDGNKRVAFVAGILLLELNGLCFSADEAAAADMVIRLASSEINEASYEAFLRDNTGPAPGSDEK